MKIKYLIYTLSIFICFQSCDIQEEILDETLGENLVEDASPEAILAPAYSSLRQVYGHRRLFALQEYASDEAMLPTRASDWFDGGTFQDLHKHSWLTTHSYIGDTWNRLITGIASATQVIDLLPESTVESAEAKGLLALYMTITLDAFGQVPYRGVSDIDFNTDSQILVGDDATTVIIENVNSVLPSLRDGQNSVRFSKDAAKALLARLYLNRAVYKNPYADNFSFDNADLQKVIDLTTELISSGRYSLETDNYFSIFDPDNENHSEIIFAVKNELTSPSIGGQSVTRHTTNGLSRGYYLTDGGGVKGSDAGCTLPGFLDTWDETDPRFYKENFAQEEGSIPLEQYKINRGFLMGQQYGAKNTNKVFEFDPVTGNLLITKLYSKDGSAANHTRAIKLVATLQSDGVRVSKWGIDTTNKNRNDSGVDIPIYRLADLYLMRAEAKLRLGESGLADVNAVREARKTGFGLSSVDLNDVYNERGYEFYWEYHRRTDQIRFGTWENSWQNKSSSDVNRRLFPIPPTSIAVTPGLEQNQGY